MRCRLIFFLPQYLPHSKTQSTYPPHRQNDAILRLLCHENSSAVYLFQIYKHVASSKCRSPSYSKSHTSIISLNSLHSYLTSSYPYMHYQMVETVWNLFSSNLLFSCLFSIFCIQVPFFHIFIYSSKIYRLSATNLS